MPTCESHLFSLLPTFDWATAGGGVLAALVVIKGAQYLRAALGFYFKGAPPTLMPLFLLPRRPRHFRFYEDEEGNHASLNEVSLGTAKVQPGVSAESRTWGFAPHTAHNSLVLGLNFAERLEADLQVRRTSR